MYHFNLLIWQSKTISPENIISVLITKLKASLGLIVPGTNISVLDSES